MSEFCYWISVNQHSASLAPFHESMLYLCVFCCVAIVIVLRRRIIVRAFKQQRGHFQNLKA